MPNHISGSINEPVQSEDLKIRTSPATQTESKLVEYFYELEKILVDKVETRDKLLALKLTGFIVRSAVDTMRYRRSLNQAAGCDSAHKAQHYERLIKAARISAAARISHSTEQTDPVIVLSNTNDQLLEAMAENAAVTGVVTQVQHFISGLGIIVKEVPYGGSEESVFMPIRHVADPLALGV